MRTRWLAFFGKDKLVLLTKKRLIRQSMSYKGIS